MMNNGNVIEVEHVTKDFYMRRTSNSLKDLLTYLDFKEKRTMYRALDDVSFSVKKGEALGLIGKNGSGKSTMLKILTKILYPNSGKVTTKGKIACLIELGAGFHPDMTGRENIYINASILGLSDSEINGRVEDIINFSGIGDFIDQRVRNYSSGMYMRLAFSIAINVDADILLIDEILAVGDIEFQNKCIEKLKQFQKNGGTIVLVTQLPQQAKEFCDNVVWLEQGKIKEYGPSEIVCNNYYNSINNQ